MVMKEIPREESAEEKPLLTMTSQVGGARGAEEAAREGLGRGGLGWRQPRAFHLRPSPRRGNTGRGQPCDCLGV